MHVIENSICDVFHHFSTQFSLTNKLFASSSSWHVEKVYIWIFNAYDASLFNNLQNKCQFPFLHRSQCLCVPYFDGSLEATSKPILAPEATRDELHQLMCQNKKKWRQIFAVTLLTGADKSLPSSAIIEITQFFPAWAPLHFFNLFLIIRFWICAWFLIKSKASGAFITPQITVKIHPKYSQK